MHHPVSLEHHLNDKSGIFWNPQGYSVEHIIPQTITDEWKGYLGNDWEEIHSDWCHSLGNLTLVPNSYNSQYSNSSYDLKKESYSKYNYGLFQSIKDLDKWNDKEVKKRGQILSEICTYQIWIGFNSEEGQTFEPVMKKDKLSRMFLGNEQYSVSKNTEYFIMMVKLVYDKDPIKFDQIKSNKKLFSIKKKNGFSTYFEDGKIYLKSSISPNIIAENCSLLRELLGWSWKNWYGEAERAENGTTKVLKFK